MKVVRNQLAEGGRLADAQRSLYDLIWMGVRDKVHLLPLSLALVKIYCRPFIYCFHLHFYSGEAGASGDDNRGAY